MDATLYKAAMEGNITGNGNFILADHLQRDEENGYQVTVAKGNTILHVAAIYGHSHFVEEVLKISPRLLCYQNRKNETALHVAAKQKHAGVVRVLLSKAGEEKETLMRMKDDNGDTALHKAVRSGYLDVVKMLVKEDPEYEFPANKAGETPMYLAALSGFDDILVEILESGTKPNYSASGPDNQTPLHVAVIQEYTGCARSLLQWNKSLCEEADKWGWNSLHYAVKLGLKELVSDMLGWKKSLAYSTAGSGNDWTTTFHIAVTEGDEIMITELLEHCSDCWEMVNSSGQNVLHVAISNNQEKVAKFLLKSKNFDFLVDEPDKDGNTPIDLLDVSSCSLPVAITRNPRANKTRLNKKTQNLVDIASSWTRASKKEAPKDEFDPWLEKRIDNVMKAIQMHLVVATLVMTVTFAAGFTLPGGFDSDAGPNKGMAILTRKSAFRAFVVTDAIAFTLSACAIFIYYIMASLIDEKPTYKLHNVIYKLYHAATVMQLFALLAVVIAFVSGMYATLQHLAGIAVTVCIICCTSFLIFYWVLRQLVKD